jgi:MFS family permease
MNPVVFKVGIISFFADLSSELLYPITPVFLTQVLHASMASVGLIEGIAELTASFLKGWAGHASDRLGKRRVFIWSGYLLSTLSKASIGLAQGWGGVLLARSLDRVGKGVRTAPRDALIAEAVPKSQLGWAFGIHRGMDTLGAVIGPLLALGLLEIWGEGRLRDFYFLALIPGTVAVALCFVLPDRAVSTSRAGRAPVRFGVEGLPRRYFLFLIGWGIFSFANSSDAFLLLSVQGNGNSLGRVVLMYCLFNLVYALSSPILGGLSDRFGRLRMMKLSLLFFALIYFGFGRAWNPWLLFSLYGLFMGMSEGVGKALVAEMVPEGRDLDLGASAQGWFGLVTGVASLGASLTAGLLWDQIGPSAPFIYGSCGALLAFIVFVMVR